MPPHPSSLYRRLTGAGMPLPRALSLLILLVCLALIALTVALGWSARNEWLRNAGGATANLAYSLAQHAEAMVHQSDTVLQEVISRLEGEGFSPEAMARLDTVLAIRVRQQEQLHGLFVYDEGGRWIAHTQSMPAAAVSNAEREYFIYHRTHADRGLHIGIPVRSKSTGDWILPLSRRFNHPDGSFAGVALATIRLARFDDYYQQFHLGEQTLIAMNFSNGTVVTRRPFKPDMVGADLSGTALYRDHLSQAQAGTMIHVSPLDRVERQYAFRRLQDYPLTMVVAIPTSEILAGWRSRLLVQSAALAGLIAFLAAGGFSMVRQARLQLEARKRLNESYAKVRNLEQALDEHAILAISDTRHRLIHANDRFCRISGYSLPELLGRDADLTSAGCNPPAYLEAIRCAIEAGQVWKGETMNRRKDGSRFWLSTTIVPFLDEQGKICQYVAIRDDITAQKEAEENLLEAKRVLEESNRQLSVLSREDSLTGLANRREFDAALAAEYQRAVRAGHALALLMIDVDHFKTYNDRYGHPAGDACLRQVAQVLQRQLRSAGDLASRYGGEEFAVLLPNADRAGAAAVAQRIGAELRALALPHADNPRGRVTASIGYHIIVPAAGDQSAALVAGADQALYACKSAGRDRALACGETA